MNAKLIGTALAVLSLAAALPAHADMVTWADLTSDNGLTYDTGGQVYGTVGGTSVTFTGDYAFDQLNNSGINYWTYPDYPYTPVLDAPSVNSDIIALSDAGLGTITFDQTEQDVFIAFNSFNSADVTFNAPFTIVSQGCGYWGCGTFIPISNFEFFGNGELVGVLEFHNISSLTFYDSFPENWHGIDVGVGQNVPEPGTLALFGMALLALGGLGLRRKFV